MNLNNNELKIIEEFKNIFYNDKIESLFSDEDWISIAIGFMIAKGIEPERAFELSTKIEDIKIVMKEIETSIHFEGFDFHKFDHIAKTINEILGVPWGRIDIPPIVDGFYTSEKDGYILQIFPDCWKLFVREVEIKEW